MEVHGLLDAGEIYHKFWQDKGVKEVECMRAPMCAHFNIVKQQIKNTEQADYWFKYIKDCIILNSWDTLRNAESGADCDGDILFTTNNKVLVDNYRELPALDCQQHKAPKMLPTEEKIAASNKKGFKNKVGSITNIGTSMLNLQSKFPMGSKEWNELEYRVICIQHFQQLSIDSVKGIKMTKMNEQWNSLSHCLPSDGDDDTVAVEKAFNKTICAHRKPFFFIYRYNTTKAEYDKYVKTVNSKLKLKYHITLDDLLNAKQLPEELEREREYFYNKCPVDMSPGTVNRIAWAVNDKFEEFDKLEAAPFDKELIKSGVEYSKTDFYKVAEVYKQYKESIVNLAKKINTDEVSDDDGLDEKSVIDLVFQGFFYEACPNEKMLCDILIDLLYDKPNAKGVVWSMCGDVIINNLLEKANWNISYPEAVHEGEEFGCCRKKFVMKHINVRGENCGEI
jgi:hypothetical protein